jgi:hypothetical protein
MASPGITPIQLIAATNPCLCGYLAEADGALLDAIARPEEASRTLLIRLDSRCRSPAPLSSAPITVAARRPHPCDLDGAAAVARPQGLMLPALGWRAAPRTWRWPFAPPMTVRILIVDGLSGAAFLERHIAPLS